jgi:UDP-N-acetylglucosamine 2-epimerase
MKKTVMTISGIRPDFIRMSSIFKKLDLNFNHILVHTGQHYDKLLSDVFFNDLEIRKPDFILHTGENCKTHYEQLSYLSTSIIDLIKNNNLNPDIILFLGDSNTVCSALPLRKEGFIIGHIEAGMRSYDKRMFEEINRTVCDHCSHILFVYHEDYKKQLENENITENVFIVGNTITEVCKPFIPTEPKKENIILLDIHRPENFKYKSRMENIIKYATLCSIKYNLPIKMLKFYGTCKYINEFNLDLGKIELIDLMSYKQYLNTVYHSYFLISDSGTGQEEPAFFNTPVIVPRDFTERPQSLIANCSFMLECNHLENIEDTFNWISQIKNNKINMDVSWLGDGTCSDLIIKHLQNYLQEFNL